jgi:hypothetical protein
MKAISEVAQATLRMILIEQARRAAKADNNPVKAPANRIDHIRATLGTPVASNAAAQATLRMILTERVKRDARGAGNPISCQASLIANKAKLTSRAASSPVGRETLRMIQRGRAKPAAKAASSRAVGVGDVSSAGQGNLSRHLPTGTALVFRQTRINAFSEMDAGQS